MVFNESSSINSDINCFSTMSLDTENYDHSHCDNCIKIRKCKHKNSRDFKCPIIACGLNCGFEFHQCKSSEHELICMNEKIKCINHSFGCPVYLPRNEIAKHIPCCPSSVIHCYLEWNRWPIYTRDRKLTQPIVSHSLDADHLDVALTLRDQRMLEELWKAIRSTRTSLRNSLTRKYPAVPLKPYCGTHVDSAFSPASPTTSAIITPQNVSDDDSDSSPWQMARVPPGLQRSVCARLSCLPEKNCKKSSSSASSSSLASPQATPSIDGTLFQSRSSDNLDACHNAVQVLLPHNGIPTPPSLPNCTSLSLDLNLNSFAPFQAKPKLMYTFRCAQEFRRDEYGSHYKNFHGDILGSLNGWMEHRCPLWQYGCSFVYRRMHPMPKGTKIIFNPILESFGHVLDTESHQPDCDFSLSDLPSEILRHICHYLDGFSLNNLSLTCHKLRNICSTLLESRGIVVLQWERRSTSVSTHKWVVGSKKWTFTTNFTEVRSWYLDDSQALLNHIRSCPHYEYIKRTEPFTYGGMSPKEKRKDENKKDL